MSNKSIALIPARGGSKQLPGKNIKTLNGLPLIVYTIKTALQSTMLDRVICSTDNEQIAKIASDNGADVPFLRPKSLAEDDTPDRPVMTHCINWLKENQYHFDTLVYLRPTTPFKSVDIINQSMEMLELNQKLSSIRTITKVDGINHPYWMFRQEKHILKPFIPDIDITSYYQRQMLPDCYRLNGLVDALRVTEILDNKNPYGESIGYIEVDNLRSIDIDTEIDFYFSEFLIEQNILNTM